MKKLLLLLSFSAVTGITTAQITVSVDSVSKHINEIVTVCSKVHGIKSLDKVTFINLAAAYPQSPLTIVVFAKDYPNFKDFPITKYTNKQICVTGKLIDYKGKPEIIVSKPNEITIQ